MKKITCMAMMAVMLLMALPAQAQFSWGIKAGVNLGSNDLAILKEKGQAFSKDSYTGYFFGPKAEVRIPVLGLGIEASALYAQQGMTLVSKETFKQNSFQIPLNLKYSFGLGNAANIFVAAGPEFGFNVGDTQTRITNIFVNEDQEGDATFEFKKTTLNFNIGVGATLFNHVQLGVNYHFPWGTVGEFKLVSMDEVKSDADTADRIEGGNVTVEDVNWLNKKADQAQRFSDNFKAGIWQFSVAYLF